VPCAAADGRLVSVDFLLECIGFPPDMDTDELALRVRAEGEAVAWRGDPDSHRRLDLGGGLELRVDREPGQDFWTLLPHYRVTHRLRFAVESLSWVPDSPFDALLTGWASPPPPGLDNANPGDYRLSTWLTDARRLPRSLPLGHVLAISVAGFALDLNYVGPNEGVREKAILERPRGAWIAPLGSVDSPGGCSDVSIRIKEIRHLRNRLTGRDVDLLVADAPERPMLLFVSPWQLEQYGLKQPRPGWRIEGTFMFTGRVAGGLNKPPSRAQRAFG